MQPPRNGGLLTQLVRRFRQGKEGGLKRILAIFSVSADATCDGHDHGAVSSYKFREGVLVPSLLKPHEQLRIGSRTWVKPLHNQAK